MDWRRLGIWVACAACTSAGSTGDPLATDADADADADTDADSDSDPGSDSDADSDSDSGSDTGSSPPTCSESCDACADCLDPLFDERGGCALAIKMCAMNLACRALLCCWTGCGGSCSEDACADPSCDAREAECDADCQDAFCGVGACLSDHCGWPYCEDQCPPPAGSTCEACVGCRSVCE